MLQAPPAGDIGDLDVPLVAGRPVAFMAEQHTIVVVSDIHYASEGEIARRGHESRVIHGLFLRLLAKAFRHYIWLRDPLAHNHLLPAFIRRAPPAPWVVANGDYSCDSQFTGLCDEAAYDSARVCLDALRAAFGDRLRLVYGDHELGKRSLFGGAGGLRWQSFEVCRERLAMRPFWQERIGNLVLMGVVSSLLALPVYEPETLEEERTAWWNVREAHLRDIRAAFAALGRTDRVLLFCHDPTALPFLAKESKVVARMDQIEATIIGHLHSDLMMWASGMLAGMPEIRWMGNAVRRMSAALHEARCWRRFHVRLCPSLSGSELLKDGGFLRLDWHEETQRLDITRQRMPRTG